MKILALLSTYPKSKKFDGAAPFMHNLYRHMSRKGHKIRVLAPHAHGLNTHEIMNDVEVFRFRYFFPTRLQKLCYSIMPNLQRNPLLCLQLPFLLVSELYTLNKHIKEFKPDVIHTSWIIPQGFVSAIASYFYHKPFFLTSHGGDIFVLRKKLPFLKHIYRWIVNRHKVSAVNPSFVDELNELSKKSVFIPNGVDPAIFNDANIDQSYISKVKYDFSIGENDKILLFAGRLTKTKGVQYAINTIARLSKSHPNLKLLIAGEGDLRQELENQARKLNLKSVHFLGWIQNSKLPSLYSLADILIAPSFVIEGFPSVFLESMLMKVPVVATDIKGIDRIFTHRTNILISKQKSVESLTRNITELLNNHELRATIIKNAHKDALEKYSWNNIAQQYVDWFQR